MSIWTNQLLFFHKNCSKASINVDFFVWYNLWLLSKSVVFFPLVLCKFIKTDPSAAAEQKKQKSECVSGNQKFLFNGEQQKKSYLLFYANFSISVCQLTFFRWCFCDSIQTYFPTKHTDKSSVRKEAEGRNARKNNQQNFLMMFWVSSLQLKMLIVDYKTHIAYRLFNPFFSSASVEQEKML